MTLLITDFIGNTGREQGATPRWALVAYAVTTAQLPGFGP